MMPGSLVSLTSLSACNGFSPNWWILSPFFGLPQWCGGKQVESESCPTLCNPIDCSLPGSFVHGIFQAKVLEWVATSFFRGSSWIRDWTRVSHTQVNSVFKQEAQEPGFDPWVRKTPWNRKWQPSPIFSPGKFNGQRAWQAIVYGVAKSWKP